MERAFAYVEQHIDAMLTELAAVCSFRSVAGDREGLCGVREYIKDKMESLGLSVCTCGDGENAMLYAQRLRPGRKTLLLYNHYDVVPEGPREFWKQDPFTLQRGGDILTGRGVSDNKGALMARLHALEAIRASGDSFPVGVKMMADGDEESGSTFIRQFSQRNPERFREMLEADLCLWENGGHNADGQPLANFGVRSTCGVDLFVKTSNCDEHARTGAEIPNAAWRLAWALASIKDMDERILIDGFYDDVQSPTEAEIEVLESFPFDEEAYLRRKEIPAFLCGLTGLALKKKIYLEPSVTVSAMESGRPWEGVRSIVPHTARARLNFLMVPDQRAETIAAKLRLHLDQKGFSDVQMTAESEGAPVKTPVNSPYRGLLERAAAKVYDKPLSISITQLGSGPAYMLRDYSPELPIICGCGVSSTGSAHHSPTENISIKNYVAGIKHTIATLYEMAEMSF